MSAPLVLVLAASACTERGSTPDTPASAAANATDARPPASAPPPADLAARITATFGARCKLQKTCGALLGIDCNSAADGPYFYVRADSLEKVSVCGGACMRGRCTNCPPAEWTCR